MDCLTSFVKLEADDNTYVGSYWFSALCIMGLCHYVLLLAYEPIARAMADREIQKLIANQSEEPENGQQ